MKKYAILALALASTLTFGSAVAEPFNERGKDFIGSVETSSHTERQPVAAELDGFNNRGKEFSATMPAGSYRQSQPIVARFTSYNERG